MEQQQTADNLAAQKTLETLRRASEDERLEYERLLQAAFDHKSRDEMLQQQRLAASQGGQPVFG